MTAPGVVVSQPGSSRSRLARHGLNISATCGRCPITVETPHSRRRQIHVPVSQSGSSIGPWAIGGDASMSSTLFLEHLHVTRSTARHSGLGSLPGTRGVEARRPCRTRQAMQARIALRVGDVLQTGGLVNAVKEWQGQFVNAVASLARESLWTHPAARSHKPFQKATARHLLSHLLRCHPP